MKQATYRTIILALLTVAIPLAFIGAMIFLSAAVPFFLVAVLVAGVPLTLWSYSSDRTETSELAKRLRMAGRMNLWKRAKAGESMKNAGMPGMDLSEIRLQGLDLSHANLEKASLERADLQGATLTKANLRNANLRGANFKEAHCEDAIWSGAVADDQTHLPFTKEEANQKGVVFVA